MSYRMEDKFWTTSEGQSQFGLSQTEKDENASRIYTYFIKKGWSKNSICAMLGNMDVESRLNPRANNQSTDSYGLVQWHSASKLINWANANDLNYELGSVQCQRIKYEEDNSLQWSASAPYTFSEWATNTTADIETLTVDFLQYYEVADFGTRAERVEWALYYADVVELINDFPVWLIPLIAKKRRFF